MEISSNGQAKYSCYTMAEWFQKLESNDQKLVEEAKRKFHDQFNSVKESWLLNGLYDYYLSTNSVRSMEILINIREPHYNHLFDKLSDSIRGSKTDSKVQALILLGHVVSKHPTWLHKITQHTLFKDIIKLLKNEGDILPLVSALLLFIVLLPYIPASMNPYLQDVFEIFSRLAAWNCNNPGKLVEEQMVHMQVGLYALFQRLYGMYPCNFLTYLRNHYRNKEVSPIFIHTIKPMLQTVQMHPLLVTNSKDFETTTERWKKMEAHDVVVECERFSMGLKDRFSHDTCMPSSYRSRSGTTNSTIFESYQFLKIPQTPNFYEREFFSPTQAILHSQTPPVNETSAATAIPSMQGAGQSLVSGVMLQSQEGTSPPEAAIEATPETTPIKDIRLLSNRHPPNTGVMRALNNFNVRTWSVGSASTTPTHSQPSSPMRKDVSTFNFTPDIHMSAFGLPKRETSFAQQKLQKLKQERSQVGEGGNESSIRSKPQLPPTSPLRIIPPSSSTDNSIPNSPLPLQRIDSPVSLEDEEVLAIVRQGELGKHQNLRQCDSVLHDVDRATEEEIEDCEHGSPCTSGGLHMPNIKQMNVFRMKMNRLRYHSQCGADGEQMDISTTGSSPGNTVPSSTLTVRRANSCPEMKKGTVVSAKDNINKTLEENDEETNLEDRHMNGFEQHDFRKERFKKLATSETQTENFWPMPYEHLFLSIFPSLESTEIKPSPAPSPAPFNLQHEKYTPTSSNDILDRYIDAAYHSSNDKETTKNLKDQMQLLHQQLLFERHRRETHAIRNRTLFTDVTRNKVLEEHNSALTDQVKLQEKDIDALKFQIDIFRRDKHCREKAALDNANYWELRYKELEKDCKLVKEKNEDLQNALELEKTKVQELDSKWQTVEATLLDANAEVRIAKEQVLAGEKGRVELELANKELLLAGELILKYKERLSDLTLMKQSTQELSKMTEVYMNEIKGLHQQLDNKTTALEACRVRISELEHNISQQEEIGKIQKKILNEVKEECHEKLKASESKYQTLLCINRSMEEKILDIHQQIEFYRRTVHSPDTSSCHEVNATLTDRTGTAPGLSPHSSPLSASLASSEGSVAFMHTDVREMKNLQVIVDQKEPSAMRSSSTIDSDLSQEACSPTSLSGGQASTSKTD